MKIELNSGSENTTLLSCNNDVIVVLLPIVVLFVDAAVVVESLVVVVGFRRILYRNRVAKKMARLLKKAVFKAKFARSNCILGYVSINVVKAACEPGPMVAKYKTVPICICIQNK